MDTYHALQLGNVHPIQQFTGLVTVTDILEGFCCVLTADVEEDFLTTTIVYSCQYPPFCNL